MEWIKNIDLIEWFGYEFMRNAFIGILLITPLYGLTGTLVVTNRMSFYSDALGHCALTGVALGVIAGIRNPTLSLIIFAILYAIIISGIMESGTSSTDTIIGVFSSTGVALGIVLLSYGGGFSKYSSYLIGDILTIQRSELIGIGIIFLLTLFFWVYAFNPFLLASISTDLGISKGVNVSSYKKTFMVLVALIVTISIQWVGILIISSLLILPAAAARNIAKDMKSYHFYAVLFSVTSGLLC